MNAYLFNDFEVNVKIHGEDLLISCEDVSKCIDEEWVDIYFYKNKCYREFSDNIHWIDDTTLTSYLTIENKKEFKKWFLEEIRRPWWEQVAAEEEKERKEKRKKKNTTFRNKNWDVYLEGDMIPVSAIGQKFKMSGKKVNEFLLEKGIVYKTGDMWHLEDEYCGMGYKYIYNGQNKVTGYNYKHLYWTQAGAEWITNMLIAAGHKPIA